MRLRKSFHGFEQDTNYSVQERVGCVDTDLQDFDLVIKHRPRHVD